jgi:hypothetical protein
MNQNVTATSGIQATMMPMPSVPMTKAMQSATQSSPYQKVRICQRKCDSSHVPRTSPRFT